MSEHPGRRRRDFLVKAGTLGVAAACGPSVIAAGAAKARPRRPSGAAEDVTPAEDLMREHGVLNRVLLIYEEAIRRLEAAVELPPDALAGAAGIVRRFVEDYHERLEEEHLFPRFVKAGTLSPAAGK